MSFNITDKTEVYADDTKAFGANRDLVKLSDIVGRAQKYRSGVRIGRGWATAQGRR
ncbi:hypothetical protein J6590_093692 [Homalodisca vitripennis]|nr:hypothetical protein J6590_093692 [Homalodisca vitripennis]